MKINLETLKADLTAWLESLPHDTVVGIRNDPNRCVLSNFLTGIGAMVTVRKGMAGNVRLSSRWQLFYQQLDTCLGRKTGGYTAATALAVLERIEA